MELGLIWSESISKRHVFFLAEMMQIYVWCPHSGICCWVTVNHKTISVSLNLHDSQNSPKAQEQRYVHVSSFLCKPACVCNYMCHSLSSPSYLPDGSLRAISLPSPFPLPEIARVFLPWEPVLSIKLLRLNREVLEAKYWMNLWEGEKEEGWQINT